MQYFNYFCISINTPEALEEFVRDGPFDSRKGGGAIHFYRCKFFSLNSLVQLFFLSCTEQISFYSDKEDGVFFVWRNVSVLEGELVAARYCAEGTICNDRRSLQIQLRVWGRCEDTSFYSTKNGPEIDAFLPGYCSRKKNWQTKNISENNFYIPHKRGC